ncbi:MAG: D-alanine--D-alanine ligase, partial [Bacteroidia bacterium]|nr:D-alanine--D-alanine ligase [Bacteroidia bacterium]
IKVAILYGGRSVEHGVSINSARNIVEYLDKNKFEPLLIGISTAGVWHKNSTVNKDIEAGERINLQLNPQKAGFISQQGIVYRADVVFPVLHGTDGEDGSIQGLLQAMSMPMVGTGVLGSAMSMNKFVAKKILQEAGLPVAKFLCYYFEDREQINVKNISSKLGLPFMIKSASLGSSVGVSKVNDKADLKKAVDEAFKYDDCLLAEEYIKGREIECAILGNNPPQASFPGEIIINSKYEFYTFDAKYVDGEAVKIDVPAKLDKEIIETIRQYSLKAYQALKCEDFSRVDLFLADDGRVFVNEINTIPGFTNSSMFPMMWKERGLSFTDLITKLIELSLERTKRSARIQKDFQSALKF